MNILYVLNANSKRNDIRKDLRNFKRDVLTQKSSKIQFMIIGRHYTIFVYYVDTDISTQFKKRKSQESLLTYTDILILPQGVILLKIDSINRIAQIPLDENSIYIVKNGNITKISAIQYGEDKIVWKNGQVLDVIRSERVRV